MRQHSNEYNRNPIAGMRYDDIKNKKKPEPFSSMIATYNRNAKAFYNDNIGFSDEDEDSKHYETITKKDNESFKRVLIANSRTMSDVIRSNVRPAKIKVTHKGDSSLNHGIRYKNLKRKPTSLSLNASLIMKSEKNVESFYKAAIGESDEDEKRKITKTKTKTNKSFERLNRESKATKKEIIRSDVHVNMVDITNKSTSNNGTRFKDEKNKETYQPLNASIILKYEKSLKDFYNQVMDTSDGNVDIFENLLTNNITTRSHNKESENKPNNKKKKNKNSNNLGSKHQLFFYLEVVPENGSNGEKMEYNDSYTSDVNKTKEIGVSVGGYKDHHNGRTNTTGNAIMMPDVARHLVSSRE